MSQLCNICCKILKNYVNSTYKKVADYRTWSGVRTWILWTKPVGQSLIEIKKEKYKFSD